jgi:hypothetical protein
MKKFELYLGIALIITTTVLICIFMLALSYTDERLMFVTFLSLLGYITSYLFIDSYICRTELDNYVKGYDECTASRKQWDTKYSQWYKKYIKANNINEA